MLFYFPKIFIKKNGITIFQEQSRQKTVVYNNSKAALLKNCENYLTEY